MASFYEYGDEHSGSIKSSEFFHKLGNYQLFKELVQWNLYKQCSTVRTVRTMNNAVASRRLRAPKNRLWKFGAPPPPFTCERSFIK
jgi:hypothetical protein